MKKIFLLLIFITYEALYGINIHEAIELRANSSYTNYLRPGAEDVYKFHVTQNGTVTVYTKSKIDTYGILITPSREIYRDDDSGEIHNFKFSNIHVVGGNSLFIKVRGYDNSVEGQYTIFLRFVPDGGSTNCNIPFYIPPEKLRYLKTCEQKWKYNLYIKEEAMSLLAKSKVYRDAIDETDREQEIMMNFTKLVDNLVEITNVVSLSEEELKEYLTDKFIEWYGEEADNKTVKILSTIKDYLFEAVDASRKGADPTFYIKQATKATRGIVSLLNAYSVDYLTEEINDIIIAHDFLLEYYSAGSNIGYMVNKYTHSNRTTWNQLIDSFANAHGYQNTWYDEVYHTNHIINYVKEIMDRIDRYYEMIKYRL